jgi:hypothetical protein
MTEVGIWGRGEREKRGEKGKEGAELRGGPIDIACPALPGERRHT